MDGGSEPEIKPYHEFTQISVHKSGDQYYLICGAKVVFALDEGNAYSRNLSPDEIDNLKFSIMWLGPKVKVTYETSDKEAVSALLNIIKNINNIQPSHKFHGFPLGSIVAQLRAFLYEHILAEQKTFYTTITCSGEQRGTG